MPTEDDILEEMLERAVAWVNRANGEMSFWEELRETAKKDAKEARDSDDDADEPSFSERKAGASSHMADVGLASTREIQRVALEELGRVQDEYVDGITVQEGPGKDKVTATVNLRNRRGIPNANRFFWYARGATISQGNNAAGVRDPQYLSVVIDTKKLPDGDTPVEAILGEIGQQSPLKDYQ
jgi:hypothetical protein